MYINHQALRIIGGSERISMVTSFRARAPAIKDDTVLKLVRPISNIHELYGEYAEYRFGMLANRFRDAHGGAGEKLRKGEVFDVAKTRAFIDEQIRFLEQTCGELIEHDGGRVVV